MTPPRGFPEELQPLALAAMNRAGGPLQLWDAVMPGLVQELSPDHDPADAARLLADARRRLVAALATIDPQPERTIHD